MIKDGGSRFARPITGRESSFLDFFLFFCMYVNRKEEEEGETEQLQSYQFTQGYNSSQTTSPPPNFFLFFCMYVNRKEEEEGETEQLQSYQFTQGYNSSQTTSPPPNPDLYHTQSIFMSTLYLLLYTYHTYILLNCCIHNAFY